MSNVPTNLIPTRITGLPEYTGTSTLGYIPYILEGNTYKVQFGQLAAVGAVPSSRVVAAGTGLAGGGDLSENRVISIANGGVGYDQLSATGVVAGTYGNGDAVPVITVDLKGRITDVSTTPLVITGYVPDSRLISTGAGLLGGGSLASNRTLSVDFSSATPQALGSATAGVSNAAARGDHVHPAVDLSDANQTQGALPLGRGGTGDALSPVAGAVVYSTGTKFALADPGDPGQVLTSAGTGEPYWSTVAGTGTVTSVSVLTANGFAGSVQYATTTPQITINTTVTGLVKGNGSALSAAVAGVDYAMPGANSDITSLSGLTGGISTPDYIDFDTAATVTRATGRLWWDNADGNQTLSLGMAGSNATLQIGEEMYFRIKASSAITEGQVVMFTGTVGNSGALTGAPATGLTKDTASYVMGVATEDIANNDWGYVTQFGLVRNINTTGGAEAWVDGQILYYNPAVAGGLTKNVPAAPNAKVEVAAVVHAASNGSLFVRPVSRFALGQLNDVETAAASNGDLLQYNGPSGYWQHVVPSTISVGTATNLAGGAANRIAYQTGAGATSFISAPVTPNTFLEWSGSAFQWSSNPLGTVTSVDASGGTTGLTFSGGPITTSGILTLGGTLGLGNGGTGATTASGARTSLGLGTAAVLNAGVANGVATLDSAGTVPTSQLPAAVLGALNYQGVWNASTNTPTLTSSVGTKGYYYVVDVAGSTDLNGITDWKIGDWAVYNGTVWQKIDNTDGVTSVNGYTGAVSLTYSDVGAPSTTGTGASGTWNISVTGNAANVTGVVGVANGGTGATSLSSGYLLKGNGTSAVSASVIYDDGTNVGIGTSSPSSKFVVSNSGAAGFEINPIGSASAPALYSYNRNTNAYDILTTIASEVRWQTGASPSERMRITSAGDVGIGTSSPVTKLDVRSGYITAGTDSSTASSKILGGYYTSGNITTFGSEQSNGGPVLGYGVWPAVSGPGNFISATTITIPRGAYAIDGAVHKWFNGGTQTVAIDSAVSMSEVMRISDIGNLGIGTSSPNYKLDVAGDIALKNNATYLLGRTTGGAATRMLGINGGNDLYFGSIDAAVSNINFTNNGTVQAVLTSAGNLGLGATPSAWGTAYKPMQIAGQGVSIFGSTVSSIAGIGSNGYYDGTNWVRNNSDSAGQYQIAGNVHKWYNAAAGSSGTTISFTQAMTLDASGNLGVGTSSPSYKLTVSNNGADGLEIGPGYSSGYVLFQAYNRSTSAYSIMDCSASLFRWLVSGVEKARIDSSGNLLLNTTTAVQPLTIGSGSATAAGINLRTTQTDFSITASNSAAGGVTIGTSWVSGGQGPLIFTQAAGERMRLDASGNLGIGTSSPGQKLEVIGSARASNLLLNADSATIGYADNSSSFILYNATGAGGITNTIRMVTNGAERMRIDSSGNVGIGTSSPNNKLDVNGSVNIGAALLTGTGVSTGDCQIELGGNRTGNGNAYIDWHATAGTDLESRIIRYGGTNGGMDIINFGTGGMVISQEGAAPMVFKTTATERVRIDSNGNVGIGTSSPANYGANYTTLDIRGKSTTGTPLIRLTTSNESIDTQLYVDSTGFTLGTFSNHPMIFYTWGGEVARFDSGGNLGIGTTVPKYSLHVFGDGGFTRNLTSTASRIIYMNKGRGTNATPTNISSGDNLGGIWFCGYSGSGNNNGYGYGAYVQGEADGAVNATTVPGRLTFATTTSGNSSPTERMRIDSSGYVLVGYTASNGAYLLQVNSQIFATNATIATSDGRYKEDVAPLTDGLAIINALNPVSFNWKEHSVHNFDRAQPAVGFIAQEVQQVLSDKPYLNSIVKRNECTLEDGSTEEFLGIAEGNMIAILVKAVQELTARVAQLEGK